MKVEVIKKKWGNYSKGDILDMHVTTAKGCIANKFVKEYKEPKTTD